MVQQLMKLCVGPALSSGVTKRDEFEEGFENAAIGFGDISL